MEKLITNLVLVSVFFLIMNVECKGQTAYITNLNSNTVSALNVQTNIVIATIPVGSFPEGVSVSSDGTSVYISNWNAHSVSKIITATNTVLATIQVGSEPQGLCVSPDGSKVYVANDGDSTVSVINTFADTISATIIVGFEPSGIIVSPDGSKVYVSNYGDNTVSVIDTVTNTVSAIIYLGAYHLPEGISITPNGLKVYVANWNTDIVSVINTTSNTITNTIIVGSEPHCVSMSPDGSKVYVSNSYTNNVSVINTTNDSVIATIPVGHYPVGLSVTPEGSKVYVANDYDSTVSVINTTTNTVTDILTFGDRHISFGNFISSHTPCTPPAMPGPINGPDTICAGVITTYLIDTVAGATSYTWTLPNGWTGTSTTTFIVVSPDSSGTITVTANDSCGSSAAQTLYITVIFPPPPITIIGPDTVCQGAQVIYYASPQSSAGTGFNWTLPTSWTGSSTSDSITVIVGANGGNITVIAQNACGSSVATLPVVVLHVPFINSIIGPNPVCAGSLVLYHANPYNDAGMNYSWTLPNGWTGSSITDSVNTTVATTGGYIYITESNQCGTRTDSLNVIVDTAPPQVTIIGPDTVCGGEQVTFYVLPDNAGTEYIWTLPGGWAGNSTSDSLTTNAGSNSGLIHVLAFNGCGSSTDTLPIVVIYPPPTPGPITGNTVVAINSNQTYSIASIANATSYHWTVPLNWVINSGQGTTSINVTVGSDTGHICVTASDTCGTSPQRCITIQMVTGINEISASGSITIYPNPNDGNFTITQTGPARAGYELGIYDVMGREVYIESINNSSQTAINISNLSDGIYFWKVISERGIIDKGKIVINR